jgi:cytochrome c553
VLVAAVWFACSAHEFAPNKQPRLNHMKKTLLVTFVIAAALCSASAGDAKENYDKGCAKCHGKEGKGDTKMGQKLGIKDYTDAKVQADMKDDAAFKAIKEGLKDKDGKVLMKPAEDLSDDDIKALVTFMRGFKK